MTVRSGLVLLVVWWVACVPPASPTSVVSASGDEEPLPPRALRVVSHDAAARSGFTAKPVSIPFGEGKDGTELISALLEEAEHQDASLVSDITVVLTSAGNAGPVECRTAVVPESVTESRVVPGSYRSVPVNAPVTRVVTENEYRCRMVSRLETKPVTEYEQRCHLESHPVTRTRTTYTYEYDYRTHSSRSVPRTESYTEYESKNECRSEPVFRTRTENVLKNECRFEPVTHTVTRYEFQLETQYVPPRLETFERQRLKELEPECYETAPREREAPASDGGAAAQAPAPMPATAANHVDAVFYFDAP